MATLALSVAGSAVGSALIPSGLSLFGATISGAAIGAQIGALAGSFVDAALFAPSGQSRTYTGPRLSDLRVTASTEGAPIPRLYGRARVGGQVIWATELEEEVVTTETGGGGGGGGGGKGGGGGGRGGGSSSGTVTTVEYRYYANLAVALAEGPIAGLGRVWADGQELDLSALTYRLYTGSEDQAPDSLIVAKEGAGAAPAYRGTAYVVFERMPLADYGNRLPQMSFEVVRAADDFRSQVRGVVLIPGSGEFVYATEPVTRTGFGGEQLAENLHTRQAATDWQAGIDQLQATLPNARSVSLVVSWFGTDLRAGHCEIKPGVELAAKETAPIAWSVAGVTRPGAYVVSQRDGRPAYGGTPSDQTVVAAIRDLKARGIAVTLTPFILMDVPLGNTRPDPYTGAGSQPPYPWRGRITVDPAPGRPGTPDKTAAATIQLAPLIGTANASHFSIGGDDVFYGGPPEWTLRRQVLHYAHLAVAAGGVDAFVIGTELRGLTQVRSGPASYPFVAALAALAAEVKAVLGPATKVTYAADWSEYFGHQPQDGSGDVFFHLDPLWSAPSIDAVGIDLYWPLSDWRYGRDHLDAIAGARSVYDLDYLKSNIASGEGHAWYYASEAGREAQDRLPITDGAGKPWVFRYKDVKSWWLNAHFDRPAGIEAASATGWVPQSKPVWIMEIGCPAVDKGANQPNVFVDPKSSESALPYFSIGRRDDLMQRRYLQAFHEALDPGHPGALPGLNPVSAVYGGRMIPTERIHVYAWDARPYPAFPNDLATWGDGENWRLGHWLNGRLAGIALSDAVAQILADFEFAAGDPSMLDGVVHGYVIDRVMSAREALLPLELAYFFDAVESAGVISFRHRGGADSTLAIAEDMLVEPRPEADLLTLTRGQETDLPASAKITYLGASGDYRQSVAEARRLSGASGRVSQADLALVLEPDQAIETAETWLFEAWAARERAQFTLPPSRLAVEPTDVVAVTAHGRTRLLRVTEVADHGAREIEARGLDPVVYSRAAAPARVPPVPPPVASGPPLIEFLDLPLLRGDEPPEAGYVAAAQSPWPGAVAVYRSPESTGFALKSLATAPAVIGETLDPLPAGPPGRYDRASRLRVRIGTGQLVSASQLALLAGANAAAVRNADGEWEVLQFEVATLVGAGTYELSRLLRGQAGTEGAMRAPLPAGARFVLLGAQLARVDMTVDDIRLPFNWRYGPASRDIGHSSYAQKQHAFGGLGLRPLAPAHVRGRRASGDLAISWVRRTRTGGDGWEAVDVPLGESSESYEVDILDGATVKRTLSSPSPSATYTAAAQAADFGAAQPSVSVRVYQTSAVYGRGQPASATL
jgi:hypothetical protein